MAENRRSGGKISNDDRKSSGVSRDPKAVIVTVADLKDEMQKAGKISADDRRSSGAARSPKVVKVKITEMKDEMQKEAIDCALEAFENHAVEKDIAEFIKKKFDSKHGQTWHCVVGSNFGSFVTHETNHFIYFYVDKKAILLFKSG